MDTTNMHSTASNDHDTGDSPRLMRGPDGMVGGVATGIGNYFGIDPVIVRLVFVMFTLAAFTGAIAYLILWIVLPDARDEGHGRVGPREPRSFELLDKFREQPGWAQIVIAVTGSIALMILVGIWPGGSALWAFPLLAVGVLLLSDQWRQPSDGDRPQSARSESSDRAPSQDAPAAWGKPTSGEEAAAGAAPDTRTDADTAAPQITNAQPLQTEAASSGADEPSQSPSDRWTGSTQQIVDASPTRPHAQPEVVIPRRSALGQLTLAVTLIVLGVGAALQNVGFIELQLRDYLAAAVVVLGLGLLVGSVVGHARWLALIGVLILPFLMLAHVAGPTITPGNVFSPVGPGGEIAEIGSWQVGAVHDTPTSVDELDTYRHAAGNLQLDLRELEFSGDSEDVRVDVRNLAGRTIITVPEDVNLEVDGIVRLGNLHVAGSSRSGFGVGIADTDHIEDAVGTLTINVDQLVGNASVIRR